MDLRVRLVAAAHSQLGERMRFKKPDHDFNQPSKKHTPRRRPFDAGRVGFVEPIGGYWMPMYSCGMPRFSSSSARMMIRGETVRSRLRVIREAMWFLNSRFRYGILDSTGVPA